MKRVLVLFCLVFLWCLTFISSEIIFYDEPEEVYNIGETISVNFSIENDFLISDFVETFLICDSEKFVVSKNYLEVEANIKKYFTPEFPAPINGECEFFASFAGQEEHTNKFKISDKILINYQLNDVSFLPGETLLIQGSVLEESGDSFTGVVRVLIKDVFEKSFDINNGNFSLNFTLPKDLAPEDYFLSVSAVEKNWKGEILNSGEKNTKIKILKKPTEIEIKAEDSLTPPRNFSFEVNLLDQSGGIIKNETLIIKILDPSNNLVFQEEIFSGENTSYFFQSNSSKGGWYIYSYYGSIFSVKPIYVMENKEIEFYVLDNDNKVIIENIGNVPYEGVASFDLQNNSFEDKILINLSLGVGEKIEHALDLEGVYNISFEGEEFNNVYLTGASILFKADLKPQSYFIAFGIIAFGFLIFISRKKIMILFKKIISRRKKPETLVSSHKESKGKQVSGNLKSSPKIIACIIFMEFDKPLSIKDVFVAHGFSLRKVGERTGYVLFYSSSEKNPEKKMFNFARELRNAARKKGMKVSIAINSTTFKGNEHIKKFALFNRKLVSFADNEILIPRKVYKKISKNPPKNLKTFNVLGKEIEVCVI
ncbi:hypothetical protein K9L16_01425 [Candidatus Pacearchaeota archaeon]|nr:hypothetical protein [Candidatus Pacearchaeota archaeon]